MKNALFQNARSQLQIKFTGWMDHAMLINLSLIITKWKSNFNRLANRVIIFLYIHSTKAGEQKAV